MRSSPYIVSQKAAFRALGFLGGMYWNCGASGAAGAMQRGHATLRGRNERSGQGLAHHALHQRTAGQPRFVARTATSNTAVIWLLGRWIEPVGPAPLPAAAPGRRRRRARRVLHRTRRARLCLRHGDGRPARAPLLLGRGRAGPGGLHARHGDGDEHAVFAVGSSYIALTRNKQMGDVEPMAPLKIPGGAVRFAICLLIALVCVIAVFLLAKEFVGYEDSQW